MIILVAKKHKSGLTQKKPVKTVNHCF